MLKDPKVRAAYLGEVVGRRGMTSGLSVTGLTVERGGKPVIHGVDVDIAPGQITALLGANGAGKSSLVLTIAGALPAARGEILLDGKSINGLRPENVRRLGVVAVPEGHRVLTDLTVEENLRVAGTALEPPRARRRRRASAWKRFPS